MPDTQKPYVPNQNRCECCSKKNLPEPIVFAQRSRLDSTYVCGQCYADHNYTAALVQNAALWDELGGQS